MQENLATASQQSDDIMDKTDELHKIEANATEGNMFFQLISELQERTAIIITTNKGFEEWTEFLGDAALDTAILDRLAYQCDKIPMNGKSYRLENRKSIFRRNGIMAGMENKMPRTMES